MWTWSVRNRNIQTRKENGGEEKIINSNLLAGVYNHKMEAGTIHKQTRNKILKSVEQVLTILQDYDTFFHALVERHLVICGVE